MQVEFDLQLKAIDKRDWPKGPWQSEPDKAEWRDAATRYPCLALRHPEDGSWCGYIALPADHPWVGQDVYRLTTDGIEAGQDEYERTIEGREITYGPARCQAPYTPEERARLYNPAPPWHRVCHTPRPGESEDVRWIGFDCSWSGQDYEPARAAGPYAKRCDENETYKTLDYVVEQCALLARQAQQAMDAHRERTQDGPESRPEP